MTFQFQCPQGHLLEGDSSQAGQQCTCPTCGMLFVIPAPPQPAAPASYPGVPTVPAPMPGATAPTGAAFPSLPGAPAAGIPTASPPAPPPPAFAPSAPAVESAPAPGVPAAQAAIPAVAAPAEPDLLHIPCPNGHELETPVEMLDQEVMCPHCNAQFRLHRSNSVEYKRKKQAEQERRDRKAGKFWFNSAIVFAVLVVLGLLFMIFSSSSD